MSINPTRRQHYVPQAYLRRWCLSGDRLAALIDGKIIPNVGIQNLAVERDIYAFVDLSSAELEDLFRIVRETMLPGNPLISGILLPALLNVLFFRYKKHDWSNNYERVFNDFRALNIQNERGNLYDTLMRAAKGELNFSQELTEKLEMSAVSGYESLQTAIENSAWPIIDDICENGLGCIRKNDQNLKFLLQYIVNQCFRGPDYIELMRQMSAANSSVSPSVAQYVRYIYPFYVVNNLLVTKKQRKVFLINNDTNLEFITTDTPYAIYGERENVKTPLITYFPLAPKKGVLFGYREAVNKFIRKYGWRLHDRGVVDWLNREVIASAKRFVFATDTRILIENNYLIDATAKPKYVKD